MFTIITVRTPPGNGYTEPAGMKRADDHLLQTTTAFFESDDQGPVKQADGTWRVRAMTENDVLLAGDILVRHYGLEIVSTETVD